VTELSDEQFTRYDFHNRDPPAVCHGLGQCLLLYVKDIGDVFASRKLSAHNAQSRYSGKQDMYEASRKVTCPRRGLGTESDTPREVWTAAIDLPLRNSCKSPFKKPLYIPYIHTVRSG
jgi:hypothetical protein